MRPWLPKPSKQVQVLLCWSQKQKVPPSDELQKLSEFPSQALLSATVVAQVGAAKHFDMSQVNWPFAQVHV